MKLEGIGLVRGQVIASIQFDLMNRTVLENAYRILLRNRKFLDFEHVRV